MKLDQTFTVHADPDVVWEALTDVMRVAPNLPGAAITEDAGDGQFKGEFKVKIGPTTAAYNGAMKIESLDQDARVATMSARGTDKRGNGGATATIVSRVGADPDGGGTRVDVETDFSITGKLARFGRGGMIQDVSNRLLREFAANLQADLAGAGEATPAAAPAASATAPGAGE
ncbi:MAG: carbon monoxide dehydrogenase, partial [Solirubrobacterales bacterium]|nr:carbon monoxide dehydrogenase [Solirubrobacterales bacterium]